MNSVEFKWKNIKYFCANWFSQTPHSRKSSDLSKHLIFKQNSVLESNNDKNFDDLNKFSELQTVPNSKFDDKNLLYGKK